MIDKITINGITYKCTATENPQDGDNVVTVDGVTYVIGEQVSEATASDPTSVAGDIEKIVVNGQLYDIRDVEDVAKEAQRAQNAERALGEALQNGLNQEAAARDNLAKDIRANAMQYDTLGVSVDGDKVKIYGRSINATPHEVEFPAATTGKAGVITASDKKKLDNLAVEGADVDLNTYMSEGTYFFSSKKLTNVPILNDSIVSARLTVLTAYDGTAPVITQVLNLNNLGGGEGNVYIRANQKNIWKPWGKLQTNVEVGQITPDDISNLIDNGIYSGVCVDGTTVETFVLIVINNYLAASQAGFGSYISQLKYAIDLNRGNTVKTRTRDAYGIWNEWSEIGGSTYELPEATYETLGGVKLGTTKDNDYMPLVAIKPEKGGGVGIKIDSSVLQIQANGLTIPYNPSLTKNVSGLSIKLGTGDSYNISAIIPCVLGTSETSDGSVWNIPSVGIPYNQEQFCLKENGLNLVDSIGSGVVKATWDANSNMNNYTTPGIYDIYGERTNANDNLPITQAYNGASIAARLTVVASTLQPSNTEKCITQFLQLSNRMGGEGNTYIRTYNENNNGLNGWGEWKKQQGMVESYINTNAIGITATGGQTTGLNGMTENGMYSGIYTDDYTLQSPTFVETFVLVVINDYAVSSQAGTPRRISQLKYATDTLTGQCTVKKRVGTGGDSISWGDWEEIGGGSSLPDNINNTYTNIQIAPLKDFIGKSGSYYVINWNLKTATFTDYSGNAAYTLAQALENNVTLKGAVYNYIKKFSPSFGDNTYAFTKIDQMYSSFGSYHIYGYFAEVVILNQNNVLASGKIFVHGNDASYTLLYETTETAL